MMNHIEKEYQQRFNKASLSNDDFDVDGLWSAIEEDLDRDKRRKPFFWLYLFSGLMIIGSITLYIGVNSPMYTTVSQNTLSTADTHTNNETTAKSVQNETSINNSYNVNKKQINQSVSAINTPQKQPISTTPLHPVSNTRPTINTPHSPHNSVRKTNDKVNEVALKTNEEINEVALKTIDLLPVDPQLLSHDRIVDLPTTSIAIELIKPSKENLKLRPTIGCYSGFTRQSLQYKTPQNIDDFIVNRKNFEQSNYGLSTGFNTRVPLYNNITLTSGLNYQQLFTKFEFQKETITQIEEDGLLVKVWIDATSGDTLQKEYGSGIVEYINERHVVHYNETRQFAIPILLGYHNTTNRWAYGIALGGSLNFITAQNGRTLDANNNLVFYDKQSPVASLNNFHMSLSTELTIAYAINKNWYAMLLPQYNYIYRNNYLNPSIKVHHHHFAFNLGVMYRL